MASIHVLNPGFQTTIQDLGRFGFAHLGVSASGASDTFALRAGNLLVGNPEGAAALEMTLVGGTYEFDQPCTISLTGSDFNATVESQNVPLWTPFTVNAGERLVVGATTSGARCYLCARGGMLVRGVLNSASTHLTSRLGGLSGKPLQKGDKIEFGSAPNHEIREFNPSNFSSWYGKSEIRVTAGIQENFFAGDQLELFYSNPFEVSEDSNRMGLRLIGPSLTHRLKSEILTEGAPLGAIQIPQSGQPIILFVEHQTTGGYPKLANVVGADMHLVGQLRPRDAVRFRKVTFEEARLGFIARERFLQSLRDLSA